MATVREALAVTAERLAAVTDTPDLEANLLAGHAWGWNRTRLILERDSPCDVSVLEPLVRRRLAAEPVAYILGQWEFFSLEFDVEAPLLVPRPETEHLVEQALEFLGDEAGRVLDLCTGTGCVAIALAANAPACDVWATDLNPVAVRVARQNARRNKVQVTISEGDLFAALPADGDRFHVIVANPPYVESSAWEGLAPDIRLYEDRAALLSGDDGLDCVRRIVAEAPRWLQPGGLLAMEIGERQGAAVIELLQDRGFHTVGLTRDLAGHERIVYGNFGAASI